MEGKLKRTIRNLGDKLGSRYKVSIVENGTAQKVTFKISIWILISGSLALLLSVLIIFTLLLKYTSLNKYLIGDDTGIYREELLHAYERIDSLGQLSIANELYLSNLQKVISGTVGESIDEAIKRDSEQIARDNQNASAPNNNNKDKKYLEDEAVLKSLIELQSPVLASEASKSAIKDRGVESYSFYSPVKGMVTAGYDKDARHFATDIATKMNEPIKSILDGHVIFSSFTPSTGYVTIIQHRDNLVSIYKHCEALLKKEGVFVSGGEVIALAGNTGELTTGPHLHFELWYNGSAVNAEDYINF